MTTIRQATHAGVGLMPPYPAALTIVGSPWHSVLEHDHRVILARPVVQIGRMTGNDLVLDDPQVSRHHAVVRWSPTGYEIEDLGSINGIQVDGQRIQGKTLLAPGQSISIGATDLIFNVLQGQPPHMQSRINSVSSGIATDKSDTVSGGPAPQQVFYQMLARRRSPLVTIGQERHRVYWRILLIGLLAYAVTQAILGATNNLHLVPLTMAIASALVPVVFVVFCWEQSAFAGMPASVVASTFAAGAILGLSIAALVEPLFLSASGSGITLKSALIVGTVEECAKVVAVLWFLKDKRLRSELDGLILGAAAGMGFAALETAGYGFVAFLAAFTQSLQSTTSASVAIAAGIAQMNHQLLVRMALAIFGHGVWTAIICAVIWRERRNGRIRLTVRVTGALALAIALHAAWDWSPLTSYFPPASTASMIVASLWFGIIGAIGLGVLRRLLRESLDNAKRGIRAVPSTAFLDAHVAPTVRGAGYRYASSAKEQTVAHEKYCPRCDIQYAPEDTHCARCGSALIRKS